VTELIIFDCDGTLVDSEYFHQAAIISVLEQEGITGYTHQYCLEHFAGKGMSYVIHSIEEKSGVSLPENFMDRYIQFYTLHMQSGLAQVPGAGEAVQHLSQLYKTCVASNGETQSVSKSLQSAGLYQFFGAEKVFTKNMVAKGKPAPDLFLFAADRMQANPSKAIVVEDSIVGVQAGLSANMTVIGLTAVHPNRQEIEKNMKKIGVSYVAQSWKEVLEYVEKV
jgi:HAD superfamily hydrolase (TIGR01509 family)